MERRNFLRLLVGGVAVVAAERVWPFRVYSFPSEIKIATPADLGFDLDELNRLTYQYIIPQLSGQTFTPSPAFEWLAREKGW